MMMQTVTLLVLTSAAAFQSTMVVRTPVRGLRATEPMPVPEEPMAVPEERVVEEFDVRTMPGVTAPLGFFDPLGLSKNLSEKRVKYFREAELKHGRVAMLAALGFPIAEKFHPLFGGHIDVPSYAAYQATPLQTFWPVVVLYVGFVEIFSVLTFDSPFDGAFWTIKASHTPGDFDFDPLDQKPADPKAYADLQNKELNNGRLAMIAIAGMVAQELATGKALF